MKENGLASSSRRDERGSVLLEFALVFPLLVLVILGTIDASLVMYDWSAATKATYRGARVAIVNTPVSDAAQFATSAYTARLTKAGNYCFDNANGNVDSSAACPTVSVTCKGGTGTSGSCTAGTFQNAPFQLIFNAVQSMYPFTLSRAQVQVKYETTGLGFVGQTNYDGTKGELPMNVTVSLRCIRHEFYFVSGILGWAFPSLSDDTSCNDVSTDRTRGLILPSFYTTLQSESLYTIP